jgi:hypothetical protein
MSNWDGKRRIIEPMLLYFPSFVYLECASGPLKLGNFSDMEKEELLWFSKLLGLSDASYLWDGLIS